MENKSKFMLRAIELSIQSAKASGGPFGCVIVKNNKIISEGFNLVTSNNDPTAHAEILAIRSACEKEENYRLLESTMYTTLEPCLMCFGAIINSRVKRLVIGALDQEGGAPVSNKTLLSQLKLNHKIEVQTGLYSDECSEILKNFFKEKRSKRKLGPNRSMI